METYTLKDMTVIKVKGFIDQITAVSIVKELTRLHKDGKTQVAVDLSEVDNLNSSALGLFIFAWKTMSKDNIMILNPSKTAHQLLTETNLNRVFKIIYEPKKD